MSVANGPRLLSIPGPTTVPHEVLSAMHRPAIDIYVGDLVETTDRCMAALKQIFRTRHQTYIYAANGHGTWEAALTNTLSRGDRVLVLESGMFARGWGEMAGILGAEVTTLPQSVRRAVDPAAVEQRLREDTERTIKVVLVAQIDTASGVVNDIPAIRAAIDAAGHPAMLFVDGVASIGTMPFEMDEWGVDLAMTGSQKGLMTPPGLGFIATGPRAQEAHKTADLVTRYWDWTFRDGEIHYMKYCGTPPEHLLFGLDKAFDMILTEGLEKVFKRHEILAGATRAAVGKWAEGQAVGFNIEDPEARSNSVTTLRLNGHDPNDLIRYCADKCGVTIGITLGPLEKQGFRIAHMGHTNAASVMGTLGVVETGLKAIGVPIGSGALEAAAEVISKAVPA